MLVNKHDKCRPIRFNKQDPGLDQPADEEELQFEIGRFLSLKYACQVLA